MLIKALLLSSLFPLAALFINPPTPMDDPEVLALIKLLRWRDPVTHEFLDFKDLTTGRSLVNRNAPVYKQVVQLQRITILSLKGQRLTVLPPEIGYLSNLKILDLGDNRLTRLPDELGNLKALEILDVWGNRLETLPVSLAELPELVEISVWNNGLIEIPLEILARTDSEKFFLYR